MPGFRIWDVYAGQEFLTPGASETLDLIEATVPFRDGARVVDVAYGRGSGAFRLAQRRGAFVLGVDTHPFVSRVASAAEARGLCACVAFIIGDGGQLPVRDGLFDVAICIGGPSIIGTERCLVAMSRALRPGGWLAVSDWTWRATPVPPEAVPADYEIEPMTLESYVGLVSGLGFDVVHAAALPQPVWDEYYAPIRARVAELRSLHPDALPQPIEAELHVYDSGLGPLWWRYSVVIARKI